MKIFEKSLKNNYYFFVSCDDEYFEKISAYIEKVTEVWKAMIKVLGFEPFFRRYSIFFSLKNHLGEAYEGAYYLPAGVIFMKPDDKILNGDSDFLWGGVVHELFHGFLEPLKFFPHGQLNFRYQNFIDGQNNNYEGFNLLFQKELYRKLNKSNLINLLNEEQKDNHFSPH